MPVKTKRTPKWKITEWHGVKSDKPFYVSRKSKNGDGYEYLWPDGTMQSGCRGGWFKSKAAAEAAIAKATNGD